MSLSLADWIYLLYHGFRLHSQLPPNLIQDENDSKPYCGWISTCISPDLRSNCSNTGLIIDHLYKQKTGIKMLNKIVLLLNKMCQVGNDFPALSISQLNNMCQRSKRIAQSDISRHTGSEKKNRGRWYFRIKKKDSWETVLVGLFCGDHTFCL